jgi:hypothetical protein
MAQGTPLANAHGDARMGAAGSPMTEKPTDDSSEKDRSAVAAKELSLADRRQDRKDLWEALNKALNTLMVGHAAGLVTCLTLIKDYKEKGVGTFIALFGVGLIIATISVLVWTVGRADYVVLPKGVSKWLTAGRLIRPVLEEWRFYIPHPQWFWITAVAALVSTGLMVAAILIAIFKFGTV